MNYYACEIIARDRYSELRQEAAGGQRIALARASAPVPTSPMATARRTVLSKFGLRLWSRRVSGPDPR